MALNTSEHSVSGCCSTPGTAGGWIGLCTGSLSVVPVWICRGDSPAPRSQGRALPARGSSPCSGAFIAHTSRLCPRLGSQPAVSSSSWLYPCPDSGGKQPGAGDVSHGGEWQGSCRTCSHRILLPAQKSGGGKTKGVCYQLPGKEVGGNHAQGPSEQSGCLGRGRFHFQKTESPMVLCPCHLLSISSVAPGGSLVLTPREV